jgi:hypothetical protein
MTTASVKFLVVGRQIGDQNLVASSDCLRMVGTFQREWETFGGGMKEQLCRKSIGE